MGNSNVTKARAMLDPNFDSCTESSEWVHVPENYQYRREYVLRKKYVTIDELEQIMSGLDEKYHVHHPFHSQYTRYKNGTKSKPKKKKKVTRTRLKHFVS